MKNLSVNLMHHMLPNLIGGVPNHSRYLLEFLQSRFSIVHSTSMITQTMMSEAAKADIHIMVSAWFNLHIFRACTGYKIAFLFSEDIVYPNEIYEQMRYIDELWVCTRWHLKTIGRYFRGKKKVVVQGIDPKIFCPERQNLGDTFKFLCIARPYTRKNLKLLVSAFLEEFEGERDVQLVLSTGDKEPLFEHKQIVCMDLIPSLLEYAEMIGQCNAFVLPTRSEGWGMPICESMAIGLPCIVPYHTGITEYCTEDMIYPLKYTMEPIRKTNISNLFFRGEIGDNNLHTGDWAAVDKEHLKEMMRYVYEHPEESRTKGSMASKHILENYSWDKAYETVEYAMQEWL